MKASEEEKWALLKKFCEEFQWTEPEITVQRPERFERQDEFFLAIHYSGTVTYFIRSLVGENYESRKFYTKLWEYIYINPKLPTEESKIFALLHTAIDSLLPYRQISMEHLTTISEEEYSQCVEAIGHEGSRRA